MRKSAAEIKFKKRIDWSAADATLQGITKGLAYLGEESRMIQEEMGNQMVEYLIEVGKIRRRGKPEEYRHSLTNFLVKNGFGDKVPVRFDGSPPAPTTRNFVGYLSHSRLEGSSKVDWVLYEMILYGMTKGLDSLGAQGQILVDRIIWEMLNSLVDKGEIERSDDPEVFMQHIGDYFIRVGFVSKIEKGFDGPQSDMMVITYTNSRYHLNVLRRLRDQGSVLYSCPPCVAAVSILKRSSGRRAQFAVQYDRTPGGKVILHHKVYYNPERFTEEQAQKISGMMSQQKPGTSEEGR